MSKAWEDMFQVDDFKYKEEKIVRAAEKKLKKKRELRGYHLKEIPKGVVGDFSKIKEELFEAEDAIEQGCKIMELVELSDLLGALELYVGNKFNMTLDDLKSMSAITQRAFKNGAR